jgi:hypothetical protein
MSATNGDPGKTWQRLAARVRTPYSTGASPRYPTRRRRKWFTAYRRDLIQRNGLTDPQALTDAYDLASLFVEWRQATIDLAQARRQQEEGQTPTPSVRTLQRRQGIARKEYAVARKGFDARWGQNGRSRPLDLARALAERAAARR